MSQLRCFNYFITYLPTKIKYYIAESNIREAKEKLRSSEIIVEINKIAKGSRVVAISM
jgi:hypothetical protein